MDNFKLLGRNKFQSGPKQVIPGDTLAIIGEEADMTDEERIERAIEIAVQYGGTDGDHHKAWVIDQMVKALAGDRYYEVVAAAKAGEDGPETYEWNEGVPP